MKWFGSFLLIVLLVGCEKKVVITNADVEEALKQNANSTNSGLLSTVTQADTLRAGKRAADTLKSAYAQEEKNVNEASGE